eukprot:scaffold17636_cov120-Isochrysis_galbana.AAC.12
MFSGGARMPARLAAARGARGSRSGSLRAHAAAPLSILAASAESGPALVSSIQRTTSTEAGSMQEKGAESRTRDREDSERTVSLL